MERIEDRAPRLRVLLAPFVSAGDVHPFLALGNVLRQRGHEVLVATNDQFSSLVTGLDLEFISTGTREEYVEVTRDRELTRPINAFQKGIRRSVLPLMERLYGIIESWYSRRSRLPGGTGMESPARQAGPTGSVVAAAGLHLGARVAQEKLGVPTATIHLQPASFRSAHQGSKLPYVILPDWYPRGFKRFVHRLLDRGADRRLTGVNEFRARHGLAPAERMLSEWWNSPQRVIGLFPEWYAPAQPDWPPQTLLTGFPLFDGGRLIELPEALDKFLDAGRPPVVFTPGSLVRHARRFFQASIDGCLRLGERAVLLTPYREQIPAELPPGMVHFDYVPLSRILPRCAALVHPGGIGTASQALAAGVPQILVPRMLDQPDNALRLARLGVARRILPWRYKARSLAAALAGLLHSADVSARLRDLAARMDPGRDVGLAADAIECLAR